MTSRLDALCDFLESSPRLLTLAKNGSTSTATRGTTKYDMHFATMLQLKKVVYHPDLVNDITRLVDDEMATIRELQIPFSTERLQQWKDKYRTTSTHMNDEASLMHYYAKTSATSCAQVASMLVFRTPESTKIICWDFANDQRRHALHDGALKVDAEAFDRSQSSLTSDARNDVKAVLSFNPTMAPWECKSLSAAPEKNMRALVDYAQAGGFFDWNCCGKAAACGPSHFASNEPGAGMAMTGARMGFDAPSPCGLSCGTKRKLDDNDNEDSEDRSYLDDASLKRTKSFFQQYWAEKVMCDATWGVFHAGKSELICIRHRATGTLYVSRLIKTSEPGYAKLHVGLYLAIWRDAVARAKMWLQAEAQKNLPIQYNFKTQDVQLLIQQRQDLIEAAQSSDTIEAYHVSKSSGLSLSWKGPAECSRIGSNGRSTQGSRASPLCLIIDDLVNPEILFVHKATLEMSGVSIRHCAIVQMALLQEQSKLEKEIMIHTHLNKKGVVGCIPPVLGMFRLTKEPCLLLITRNTGVSLVQRTKTDEARLTEKQRRQFVGVLKKIHNAGVLHGPISADDLLVDGDGQVSITGFSQAQILVMAPKSGKKRSSASTRANEEKKDAETSQLKDILQRAEFR